MKYHRLFAVALLFLGMVGCGDGGSVKPVDSGPDGPKMPQCNDGVDNDGDGKIDYPNDPGCLAPNQDSETDDCPNGPACPQCSNGIDDDQNGKTDYPDDPGCTSAGDLTELTMNPVACGAGIMIHQLPVTGTVTGTLDATQLFSQVSTCGGGDATGIAVSAYELHLATPKVIVASTLGSSIDTVLDIRSASCEDPASELVCNDDTTGTSSSVTTSLQAGVYYILVESKTNAAGSFTLNVQQLTGEGNPCLDTSECGPGLVCRIPLGNTTMSCEKPVCSDGRDDDGDGKIDYPADPGCATPTDSDETDDCPSGPNCPACSNGSDDDNDGMTDYPADTSCSSAAGASEACQGEEDPITAIVGPTTSGTLTGAHDNHDPACVVNNGPDILYTLTIPAMRSLVLDTEGTTADTVLSLMTAACSEPSLACDDDGGTSNHASRLAMSNLASGTYIVAVDQYSSSSASGPYDLHVTGVISPGGSCNPENTLGGALACPSTNPCVGPTGNMKCQPSACGDGLDNDGDGKTDYPTDPGCASLDDTDETDTCPGVGPGCPQCADGVDNDGDGQTDYPNDTNCTFPGQTSEGCASTEAVLAITQPTTQDDTTGATNDVDPTCNSTSSTALAPDHTYSLELPPLKSLSIVGNSNFDGVLELLGSTCSGTPLACQDSESISKLNVAAGNYFLVVDGWSTGSGTTTITVSGVIENGASCESPLAQSGALTCGPGFACTGTTGSRTCRPAACNDGIDNDGDGVADYPNDPGCTSASDTDESDSCPGGTGCPVCSDGLDDDGDGAIDYPNDPNCVSAAAPSEVCPTSEAIIPIVLPATAGTTVGAVDDVLPSCGSTLHVAGDLTYSLTVPAMTTLTLANVNSFTSTTSLYDAANCGGSPLVCTTSDTITVGPLTAGTYYYTVDGNQAETGSFTINVTGSIKRGESCEGPLAVAGAFACETGWSCQGTSGSRTCQPTQCNDGVDNDGDGKIDFPAEPGCSSIADDDETDACPTGPNCPMCSNGIDDDGDGQTDYPADTSCASAAGPTEFTTCANDHDNFGQITAPTTMGDLTNAVHDFSLTCQGNTSHDASYILELPVPVASLTVDTNGSTVSDTVVDIWRGACSTNLKCDDDSGSGALSLATVTNLAAGTYAITVAGYSTGNNGPFTLNVHGTVVAGTVCTSPLFTAGVLACGTGLTCNGTCQ